MLSASSTRWCHRSLDLDLILAEQLGSAEDALHPILGKKERDAIDQAFDNSILAFDHRWHIDGDVAYTDAMLTEAVLGLMVVFARIEQGLAGNATNIETGAAIGTTLVDAGHFLA